VLNADDERVAGFAEVARGPVLFFGSSAGAHFRAEVIEEHGIEGSEFDFVWPGGRARLALPLIGRHNVMNAVAALAAASVWGIGAAEARAVFPALKPADKRGEIVRFEEGFTVINDSYNSSPAALNELTRLLAATPGYRRRILAAGEMRELGVSSAGLHRECGRAAAALGKIEWIFGVQGYADDFVRSAVDAGHSGDRSQFFAHSEEAGQFLAGFLQRGDLLLLKGSRGVKMEKILEAIESRHPRAAASPAGLPLETLPKGRG
jgi:UDP-N-acetylmuramoyl-tripeptide--D-alanyl-D-alanine ligase